VTLSVSRAAQPIAIVGIGCRFPGGVNSAAQFWQFLLDGKDAIREIPRDRFDLEQFFDARPATPGKVMTRWGGFLDRLDGFDAEFFGISPREAERIDPAQRLVLETAWEALEDAGIDIRALDGSDTAVFVGQWLSDFESRLFADPRDTDFFMTTGSGRYATSGRLSYLLGLGGPSLTVDTACSSSLVAVHLAMRSLRNDECGLAIAGGVNVILQPHISVAYSQSKMMAADGRCKFGDAGGDGYVRSEGAGIVVLKPLARALSDGDRIYAVIHGSAVNNDGRGSGSMGTPSARGQEALLRRAYLDAAVAPASVGYVEAHGTGTRAGDPVELSALGAVLGEGRRAGAHARVGSVKSNFGHTEGAAGVAGLIKVALALHHRLVPASLHCRTPTPAVDWQAAPFEIARAAMPWTDDNRFGGVSAFGIAGTNAHVVLGQAPVAPLAQAAAATRARPTRSAVLLLSAGSATALKALAAAYATRLAHADRAELDAVCWSAATRRAALTHRAVFIADDSAQMIAQLRACADGADAPLQGVVHAAPAVAPVFIVPGQGGQWPGMARTLLAGEPVFHQALRACDEAARPWLGGSLIEHLLAQPDSPQLERIEWIQPVLLAVSIAYARWLESMGVEASAVIGHSMGEVGAAHLAGVLDLAQAMRIICRRSALMGRTSGRGGMAVVELPMADAEQRLAGLEHQLSVAVSNSARSCVVSGDAAALQSFMTVLQSEGVFCRAVKVDVASHSPQMDEAARDLAQELSDLTPAAPARAMVSTVSARAVAGAELGAQHWGRNLRQPVRFAEVVLSLLEGGARTFVELGPHPVLTPAIEQNAQAMGAPAIACCTGRRDEAEPARLLATLGVLWVNGHRVHWSHVLPATAPTALPLYPWQRERLWVRQAQQMAGASGDHSAAAAIEPVQQAWLHALRWVADEPATDAVSALASSWCVVGGPDALAMAVSDALMRAGAAVRRGAQAHDGSLEAAACDAVLCLVDDAPNAGYVPVRAVQMLARTRNERAAGRVPKLWIVTTGAQAVEAAARPCVAVRAAEAWGAGRVIADEHPDLWGGLIDLDPAATPQDNAAWLLRSLRDGAAQSALRDGRRFVLRLQALSTDSVEPAPIAWRADSSYLISGGLGALGLQVAAGLVAQGVRRLVLMGRHGLPPRASWSSGVFDARTAQRIAAVRALEHAGAAVHVMQVDVADGSAVACALQAFAADAWPPIRGVIHAAGVLHNRLALELDAETYRDVVAPKLDGALHLERHLPELEQLVLFSSISTVFGLPGMANYAAANAGLDALAADRRARGLPALSIQWGSWRGLGMQSGDAAERNMQDLHRQGVQGFDAHDGVALLQALAGRTDTASITVVPIDWTQLMAARRGRDVSLFAARAPAAATSPSEANGRLAHATPRERRAWMEPIVREAVAQVLKLNATRIDVRKPFGSMGLSSLLAMELRNRLEAALGRPLSATLAFNYPTIDALVGFLSGEQPTAAAPARAPSAPTAALASHEDITNLSDDEAALLLRQR
jgi:phthiocerol/phenolphthiocerol synthesis type-I polyketide synthase B